MGELLAFTSLLLYSLNSLITKVGVGRVSVSIGFMVAMCVNVLFAGLLVLLQLLWRPEPLAWNWPGFFFFVLAGIFTTLVGRFFYFEAVANFGPAKSSTYQLAIPLFTAVLAWIFLGERLGPVVIAGILVTVGGLFVAVYVPGSLRNGPSAKIAPAGSSPVQRLMLRSATLWCLSGSLSYGIGNLMRGAAVQTWNEPVMGALVGAVAATLIYLATNADGRRALREIPGADRRGLGLFVIIGVFNISAQMTGIMALAYIEVGVSSLIASCVPILVIPLSWLFLRRQEPLTWRLFFGALIATGGVALILLGRR